MRQNCQTMSTVIKLISEKPSIWRGFVGSGGGTRTPDTRIMIPTLNYLFQIVSKTTSIKPLRSYQRLTPILSNQFTSQLKPFTSLQSVTSTFGCKENYIGKCQQYESTEREQSGIKIKHLTQPKSLFLNGGLL